MLRGSCWKHNTFQFTKERRHTLCKSQKQSVVELFRGYTSQFIDLAVFVTPRGSVRKSRLEAVQWSSAQDAWIKIATTSRPQAACVALINFSHDADRVPRRYLGHIPRPIYKAMTSLCLSSLGRGRNISPPGTRLCFGNQQEYHWESFVWNIAWTN